MIKVLDCTLRDGGYYNDWDFEQETCDVYFDAVSRLPISTVEVGYCNHPKAGYLGKYFFLQRGDLEPIRARLREGQDLAVMLNAKDVTVERLEELLGDLVGLVDVVRMAVAPQDLPHGAALARELHRLGFRVGFNVMYLSTYWDRTAEVLAPLAEARDVIDSAALVDSYGSCRPAQVAEGIRGAIALMGDVQVGFHGHDNMALAFANTLSAIDAGATVVDGTFMGMGRGAGNLKTELMLVEQAASQGANLDYDALSEVVTVFEELRAKYLWGTNLPYMISGAAGLPQRDVMDWLGKNRYSVASILRALRQAKSGVLDSTEHPRLNLNSLSLGEGDEVLIVGGGPSVSRHLDALSRFVALKNVPVIHANVRNLEQIASFGPKQIIGLAGHGVLRFSPDLDLDNVQAFVVSAPPRFEGTVPDDLPRPVVQVAPFAPKAAVDALGPISDIGPLALALAAAGAMGAKRISLAGFDGYVNATSAKQDLAREAQWLFDAFQAEQPGIRLESLTPTLYEIERNSVYSRLCERLQ